MSLAARVVAGIDANSTLKDELTAALNRQGRRRRISVTDLVNPRQAFFQRARPDIQPDPERKQAMLAGTGFHEVFGRAVSTEEFVEQFVETARSEEHTSELQSRGHLVCRLLLEKKKNSIEGVSASIRSRTTQSALP